MTLLLRSLCALLLLALLCPAAAGASPDTLSVKPVFDKGGLEAGKPVEVHVLVTIEAPLVPEVKKRLPVAVSLVIDRSSSMSADKKIEYAVKAGKLLVNSLRDDDLFALTVYDSNVEVLYPLAEVRNKDHLLRIIDRIRPQSTTFLSGGLEEGIKQLEKARGEFPSRVILLSDGQANRGVTTPEGVAEIGASSRKRGVNVSTVGLGLSFNEDLMQLLAQRGGGQYYYIEDSEDLPAVFKQELDLVVRAFTKNLRATYSKADFVQDVAVYGYTTNRKGASLDIDMGDLGSGEKRQVMLRLRLTPPGGSGPQKLGELNFNYTDPESGKTRTIVVPVTMEVATDAQSLKEMENRQAVDIRRVRDEVLLLEAEQARMQAVRELEKGNLKQARSILQQKRQQLADAAKDNIVIKNKAEQLQLEERNLEAVQSSPKAMVSYSKESKAAAYKSAQGKTQDTMLQSGDRGYQVERLQRALARAGFWDKKPDGIFNAELENAVRAFQKSKNLPADGVAGTVTRQALGM